MYISNEASIIKESTYGYHLIPIQDEMLSHREVELVGEVTPEAVSDDLMETRQIIARVIADHSGRSIEEVLAKTATDSYFRAEKAVEFGLADRVIENLA